MSKIKQFNQFGVVESISSDSKNEIMEYLYDIMDNGYSVDMSTSGDRHEISIYRRGLFSYSDIEKFLPRLNHINDSFNIDSFKFVIIKPDGIDDYIDIDKLPKESYNKKIISDIDISLGRRNN